MPSFYNGKQFFLTYAQFGHENCAELITFLRTRGTLIEFVVGRELHEDGSPHVHVCCKYEQIVKGNVRYFDFKEKHPNKQDPRNWNACKQYCKKDGDFEEWKMDTEPEKQVDLSSKCQEFEKEEDWMSWCALERISYQYATFFWTRCKTDTSTINEFSPEDELSIKSRLCTALSAFAFDPDRHRVFILNGPSGCGKTSWAKLHMPKPALFVSHIDQLKCFRTGFHKSIIFDDVDFKHWPRQSQIHLVDFNDPRSIHCRYATANIPAGVFKCFTSNYLPIDTSDAAIKRRVLVFNIKGLTRLETQ
jgi:hypothetical protein